MCSGASRSLRRELQAAITTSERWRNRRRGRPALCSRTPATMLVRCICRRASIGSRPRASMPPRTGSRRSTSSAFASLAPIASTSPRRGNASPRCGFARLRRRIGNLTSRSSSPISRCRSWRGRCFTSSRWRGCGPLSCAAIRVLTAIGGRCSMCGKSRPGRSPTALPASWSGSKRRSRACRWNLLSWFMQERWQTRAPMSMTPPPP